MLLRRASRNYQNDLSLFTEKVFTPKQQFYKEYFMKKHCFLYGFIATPALVLASQFIMTDAAATSEIFAKALSKGIKVSSCQSCHNSAPGNEDDDNLKPNYEKAYSLDENGLTRLKNLINGCPAAQTLNMKTFLCEKANIQSGTVGLAASGIARTDVYAVTCGTGTLYLDLAVIDWAPVKSPLISIQASKGKVSSPLSTDTKDGDTKYSPAVKFASGAGVYTMKVNKSASTEKGAEAYAAQFSCRNSAGAPTSTQWEITQNQ